MSRNEVDHVYYNINIKNEGTTSINAVFTENRVEPIIPKANDYSLSIVRFRIDVSHLPIFIFPVDNTQSASANNSTLSVTLGFGGATSQAFLQYIPADITLTPVYQGVAPNGRWRGGSTGTYYYVFTYEHMMQIINNAFVFAFNAMPFATPPGSVPPYICYNASIQRLELHVQRQFYAESLVDPIEVWFNQPMIQYMSGFFLNHVVEPQGVGAGQRYKFKIHDHPCHLYFSNCEQKGTKTNISTIPISGSPITITTVTNHLLSTGNYVRITDSNSTPSINGEHPVTVLSATTFSIVIPAAVTVPGTFGVVETACDRINMKQNYNTLAKWNSFVDLIFLTAQMPVVYENVENTFSGQVNLLPVLQDFEPIFDVAGDSRGIIQYFPQGPYRLISMTSDLPLRKIDIRLFWKDVTGELHPVQLEPGDHISVKLMFRKNYVPPY